MTWSVHAWFGAILSASWLACSSPMSAQTSATVHDNEHLPSGDATRGRALTNQNSCTECHGVDYSGSAFYPNITPDAQTGVGSWTDAELAAAIRDGRYIDGASLCSLMERFPFSDQETADVIAYLRSLPAVAKPNAGVCPGHGTNAP
jgi:mono/diheme cytochrome c family protein